MFDDRLYSAILRSLEQTHCARMRFYMTIARFLNIHQSGVLTALAWLVLHETAAISAQILCTQYNHAPCHFMQSHIRNGVCMFSCNLPPALLAEWPGSFTCYCGNMGMEQIPKWVNPREENSPAAPAGIQTRDLSTHKSGALTTELSPPPVKRAHKARTCWYHWPFHLIYWYQVKEKYLKGMDRHNINFKMLYKCIMANTSAIWQQVAHTTYQLSFPSCSTRAIPA